MAQKQGSIGETSRYDNTFKDKPAMDFAGVNSGVKDSIIEEPVEKLSPLPMRVTADPPRNIGGTSHRSIGGVVSLIDGTNAKPEQQERRKPSIILDNSDAFSSVSTKSISRGELRGFGGKSAVSSEDDNGAARGKQGKGKEKTDIFSKYKKEPKEKRSKIATEVPAYLTVVNEFGEEIPPEAKAEPVKKISAGSTQKSAVINGGVVTERKNAMEKDRSKLFIILNLLCTNGIALLCVMFLLKSQATKDQLTQVKLDLANATATVQELSNQINGVNNEEIVVDGGDGGGGDAGGADSGGETGSVGDVSGAVQPPILPAITWKSLDVKQDTTGLTKEMWNGVSVYTPDKHISGTFLADNSYEMQGKDVKEVLRFVSGYETPKDLVSRIETKFKEDNPELKVESVLAEQEEKRSFTQIKYTKDGAIYEHYMVALRVSSDVMLEIEMISSDKTDVEVREAFTKSLIINVIPRFEEVTT